MASGSNHRSRDSTDFGVFDDAKTYYASEERHTNRLGVRTRTFSQVGIPLRSALSQHAGG